MSLGTQKAPNSDICSNFAVFQFPREDSIFCRFRSGNYARLAAVVVDMWFLWWDVVASGSPWIFMWGFEGFRELMVMVKKGETWFDEFCGCWGYDFLWVCATFSYEKVGGWEDDELNKKALVPGSANLVTYPCIWMISLRKKPFQYFRCHSSQRELLILIVASQFFLVFFGFCGCSSCCCVVMGCGSLWFTTSSKWVLRFLRAHGDGKKGRKLSLRSALFRISFCELWFLSLHSTFHIYKQESELTRNL